MELSWEVAKFISIQTTYYFHIIHTKYWEMNGRNQIQMDADFYGEQCHSFKYQYFETDSSGEMELFIFDISNIFQM